MLFDDLFKEFCGSKQKEQLQKLIGFKFKRHPQYNWDDKRFEIIEKFVQTRVEEMLAILEG